MTVMQLTMAVNERRALRGKEPVQLARIERILRWLRREPRGTVRHPVFNAMNRAPKPSRRWDVPSSDTLYAVYRRHGR